MIDKALIIDPVISVDHLICNFNLIQVPYVFMSSGILSFAGKLLDVIMRSVVPA